MDGFCRGCLIRYDDPMEMLQYTEKYRRLFVYSTGLQVKRNDTITFQLCKDCFLNMKTSCKFKKLCRASDKKFKSYLALRDIGDDVDFSTFLKNSDDSMAFRLPITSGTSTPVHHNKLRDDDNESTCTSIRNFMTDILQGEEMPDTEARIIREVIEEEADVLDDSLDSHWLEDDVSIDTDFRLDFSPFATPHAIDNDHCYTPKRFGENNDHCYTPKRFSGTKEGELKYFTSISPVRQHKEVNDFTNIIRNNQSEKELCVLGTDEPNTEISVNNFDMPIIEDEHETEQAINHYVINNEKSVDNLFLSRTDNEKAINNLSFSTNINENSISNLNLQMIEEEKSLNNLDLSSLPSIPSIDNEKLISNMDLPLDDHEKSLNSLDIQSFNSDKSINNLDLPSLPSINSEKLTNNLEVSTIDINENHDTGIKTPNASSPTDGKIYVSKEIERIIDVKKLEKYKPCTIDKNLERALENEDNKEFSLDELLVSPQVFHEASGASTPTITNILFGDKLSLKKKSPPINSEYLEENDGVDIEILEEFFQDTKEIPSEDKKEMMDINDFKVPMDVDEDDTGTKKELIKKYKFSSEFDEGQFDLENFICYICDKKFESSKAICMHFVKKHKIKIVKKKNMAYKYKPRICSFCGKEFRDLQNFHRHLKLHKNEKEVFKCNHCGLEFSSQSKLDVHKRGHDGLPFKKPGKYVCTVCGATSTTIGNFRLHQRRHTKNYSHKCQQCDKGFYRLSDFTVHMRLHTGEKPFPCMYCGSSFARKDALTKHVKYHIDNKPFQCEHCNKTYIARSQLNFHLKFSVKCKQKQGIIIDKKTLVESTKAKPHVPEIQEGSKEAEKENNCNVEDNVGLTQLPYIETEMSN